MRSALAICGPLALLLVCVNMSFAQCQPVPNYSAYTTFYYDGSNLSADVTVSGETIGNWSECMGSGTHTPEITGQVNSGSKTTWEGNPTCPGCYLTYTNGPTVPAQPGQSFTFNLQGSIQCSVVGLFWYTLFSPTTIGVGFSGKVCGITVTPTTTTAQDCTGKKVNSQTFNATLYPSSCTYKNAGSSCSYTGGSGTIDVVANSPTQCVIAYPTSPSAVAQYYAGPARSGTEAGTITQGFVLNIVTDKVGLLIGSVTAPVTCP